MSLGLNKETMRSKAKIPHCDDVSSLASSDKGSEYVVSDSDIEPAELDHNESDSESKEQQPAESQNKLRWFQATKLEDLVCTLNSNNRVVE